MKLKKKENQKVDASVLLRREIKIIKGSREWKEHGRKKRGGGEKVEESGMGGVVGDVQRVRKLNRVV